MINLSERRNHTELAEREEDAVDDGEGADVVRELLVEAGHDEADDGLAEQARDHRPLGPEDVDDERADDRAGHVEHRVRDVRCWGTR